MDEVFNSLWFVNNMLKMNIDPTQYRSKRITKLNTSLSRLSQTDSELSNFSGKIIFNSILKFYLKKTIWERSLVR